MSAPTEGLYAKKDCKKIQRMVQKICPGEEFSFLTQSFPASFELCEFILFLKLFMDKDGFVEEVQ